jgi:hypothetical protein
MGLYDSTYPTPPLPVSWTPPPPPTNAFVFTATLQLGDNSANPSGIAEINLNGSPGQIAWGTDSNGNVNSNVNYPNGVYVELDIPVNSTPLSAATLTVGSVVTTFTPSVQYGTIYSVVVMAYTNIPSSPGISGVIQVVWSDLVCTFYDLNNDPTTNPDVPANDDPSSTQSPGLNSMKQDTDNVHPLSILMKNYLVITPTTNFPTGNAVRVNISGTLVLSSTDPYYQNYGSGLTSTSLKAVIYVVANPAGS